MGACGIGPGAGPFTISRVKRAVRCVPGEVAEIDQYPRGRAHTTAVAALELVPFAMLIADGTGNALAVNQRWIDLTGRSRPDSLGAGWLDALDADHRHRLRDDILRVAAGGPAAAPATADYQLIGGARRRWARWWLSGHELEGVPLVAVAAADVDEDYARQASLYHLATHDSLTGLVNRSHFMECIEQALRRNQRASRHVGVVYVDLDGFKRINDRGGHSLGDRVLYAIAARLRHAVRSADMVARIGGDEFAVLCEGLGAAHQAEIVARRIATALTESVELDGERWAVAASVGAAVDQGAPDTAEELVDRADQAMYSIKLTRRSDRAPAAEFPVVPAAAGTGVDPLMGGPEPHHIPQPLIERRGAGDRRAPPASPSDPAESWTAHARAALSSLAQGRSGQGQPAPAPMGGAGRDPASGRPPVPEPPRAGYSGSNGSTPTPSHSRTADFDPAPAPQPVPAPDPSSAGRPPVAPDRLAPHQPAPPYDAAVQAAIAGVAAAMAGPHAEPRPEEPAPHPSTRHRLADDVISLRESIDSIRRMLDGLLAGEGGVIDIRESEPQRRL